MLGSSLFGAQLAARARAAVRVRLAISRPTTSTPRWPLYRDQFQPSAALDQPHAMAAMNVIAADSDEEAELLASSRTRRSSRCAAAIPAGSAAGAGLSRNLPPSAQAMLEHLGQARAVGSPATVRDRIASFIERTQADEIIVSGATYDPAARRRSLELTIEAVAGLWSPDASAVIRDREPGASRRRLRGRRGCRG